MLYSELVLSSSLHHNIKNYHRVLLESDWFSSKKIPKFREPVHKFTEEVDKTRVYIFAELEQRKLRIVLENDVLESPSKFAVLPNVLEILQYQS